MKQHWQNYRRGSSIKPVDERDNKDVHSESSASTRRRGGMIKRGIRYSQNTALEAYEARDNKYRYRKSVEDVQRQ